MNKILTVVITTFNRKERLKAQLKSLFTQPNYDTINIVISDNCSDYDLKGELSNSFSAQELAIVEIIHRPFNIGMTGNISNAFLLSKTKWLWLMSDDDLTTPNSIALILDHINQHPDTDLLKFTNIDEIERRQYGTQTVNNIPEMLLCCENNNIELGNLIFMSNNIYNIERLRPYLGSAFVYSYSYFPHVIPILSALNDGGKMMFISDAVVKYKTPDQAASADYLVSIYLGAMSVADIPLNLSTANYKRLCKYFRMNLFWIVSTDFYNSSYQHKRFLYGKVYRGMFSNSWSLKNFIIFKIFNWQMSAGTDVVSSACDRLRKRIRG
jgi:glycosyltransferase involved in cell wall biosynthesis